MDSKLLKFEWSWPISHPETDRTGKFHETEIVEHAYIFTALGFYELQRYYRFHRVIGNII